MLELLRLQKDGLKLTSRTVCNMSKNEKKQAEIVEEIEKISETEKVEESIEESTKPAKNKQEKVEVFQNETPRMQKFNQLNQK